jgi:hypothetical integral membrane protein (TIGR02206 family)
MTPTPFFLVAEPFVPYGASHWAVLALLVIGAAALVWWGRRHRGTHAAAVFRRAFAVLILALQVPLQVMSMVPPHWDIGMSLPLQLCDIAWMVTAYALWTCRPWAFALTYYWGLTLTIQALVTPALQFDFPHVSFFMFWGGHGLAVLAAIFLPWGLGLRPDWAGYRFTVAATLTWMAVTMLFNVAAGTNYGFLNAKPPVRSIIDLLGPWPWYLATEIALCAVVWALMTWPWTRAPRAVATPG